MLLIFTGSGDWNVDFFGELLLYLLCPSYIYQLATDFCTHMYVYMCVYVVYKYIIFLLSQQNSPSNCVSIFALGCIAIMLSFSLFFRNLFQSYQLPTVCQTRGLIHCSHQGLLTDIHETSISWHNESLFFCS